MVSVLDQGAAPDAVSPLDRPIVPSAKSAPTTSKPIGSSLRGSGIDFKDLPKRYQRKPLDQHEIDVITVGIKCKHKSCDFFRFGIIFPNIFNVG